MPRRSSKQTRIDGMSQRDIRRLERNKKYKNPRKDGTDWTNRVLQKLIESKDKAGYLKD